MNTPKKHHLLPDTLLDDHYRIQGVLGEGGFGITYIGLNERIHMRVAIKELFLKEHMFRDGALSSNVLINEGSQEFIQKSKEKFLKEARILGGFQDEPNIVDVIDYFEANQTAYLVMTYLDGITLKNYLLNKKTLEPKGIFRAFFPLIQALGKVHRQGLIHRNISPDNIIMMPNHLLILIDFGAARDYWADSSQSSLIVYKDNYAPVEQYNNNGNLGPWTDIYAICATLYECITGTAPADALMRIFNDELKRPSELGIRIDPDLEKVLMKGLQVAPEERYPSVDEMLADLEEILREEPPAQKKHSKKPVLAAAAILTGVVCFAGFTYAQKNIPAVKFHGARTETVILAPHEFLPAADYAGSKRILRERLDILSGTDEYIIRDTEEGNLQIITRLSDYQEEDIPRILKSMVTRPFRTFMGREEFYEIRPEDVTGITTRRGTLEGITPSDFGLSVDENYYYQELTLTPEATEAVLEYRTENPTLIFATDINLSGYGGLLSYMNVIYNEDSHSFLLFGALQDPHLIELFQYNLTHSKLPYAFSVYAQIPAQWEDTETSILAGINQVNADEIPENTLTIRYDSYSEELSNGQWYNVVADINTRRDALDTPYAFGTSVDSSRDFVLKLPADAMCSEVLYTLGETSVSVNTLWGDSLLSYIPSSSGTITESEEGTMAYRISCPSDSSGEEIREKLSRLPREEQSLYLRLSQIPVLKLPSDALSPDPAVLDFTQLNDEAASSLTEEYRSFLNYIDAYITDTDLPEIYRPVQLCAEDAQGNIITSYQLSRHSLCIPADLAPLEKKIRSFFPECTINDFYQSSFFRRTLTIDLPTNWSASDMETFFTQLQSFYRDSGCCDGTYDSICIQHTTQEDVNDFSVYLNKEYGSTCMSIRAYLDDEKYLSCIPLFLEQVKNNPFYQDTQIQSCWSIADRTFDYRADDWQNFLKEGEEIS